MLRLSGVTEDAARDAVNDHFGDGAFDELSNADQHLLRVPFFLDRALRFGLVTLGSRAAAVGEFLKAVGLNENQIELLASEAFALYQRSETALDAANIEKAGFLDTLKSAEILVEGRSGLIFGHQLVHQYLAGHYLVPIPAMMNSDAGHRDHRFRASRSRIGAKRRRWSVS